MSALQGLLPYADTITLARAFDTILPTLAAAATAGANAGSVCQLALPGAQLLAGLGPAEKAWLLADVVKGLLLSTPAADAADR
jgi:hypothetical protein